MKYSTAFLNDAGRSTTQCHFNLTINIYAKEKILEVNNVKTLTRNYIRVIKIQVFFFFELLDIFQLEGGDQILEL